MKPNLIGSRWDGGEPRGLPTALARLLAVEGAYLSMSRNPRFQRMVRSAARV